MATSAGGKKKGGGSLSLDDYLPERFQSKTEADPAMMEETLKAKMIAMAKSTNSYHGQS